jgi:hypothetical protein
MTSRLSIPAVLAAALWTATPAAAQNFTVNLVVDGVQVTRSFASQQEALNLLRDSGIRSVVPGYTNTSSVSATVSVLGSPVSINLPAGATTATVTLATGASIAVSGTTRGQVQTALLEIFQGNGGGGVSSAEAQAFVTALRKEVVATSAADPVAGHPLSLMGQMVASDVRAAGNPIGAAPTGTVQRPAGFRAAVGGGFASTASGQDNRFYNLNLGASYTFAPNGIEIFADAPLSSADQGGAQYLQGSLGVGVRFPVLQGQDYQWFLVPQLRAGAAGSDSLGTGGWIQSGSLTSNLRLNLPAGWSMSIDNTAGYAEARPLEFNNYKIDYALQNQFYRNGIAIGRQLGEVVGRPIHGAITVSDTRVSGDRTFVPSWQEYGVVLYSPGALPVSLSASYIDGRRDFRGLRFGLSVAF